MKKELIISNAFAVVEYLTSKEYTSHVNLSVYKNCAEVSAFFNLHDENVKACYLELKKALGKKVQYENPKFYNDNFEVLRIKFDF